jgi:type III restriction enzyme
LYKWFKKYIGVDILDLGAIYVQNIVLNNAEEFSKLIDTAVTKYKPVKEEEKKKKIKENERWDDDWEISESRNYNPDTYKPYGFKLSLYKSPTDKKTYLQLDSEPEQQFIDFLEEHKDKILWWWQNGNEHMALNFGIKYNGGSTFQPDFLVMFKDGRLGIFDTKESGFNEQDNKLKAEALQKYIDEENKKRKKDFVHGGLVIKNGRHFMINSDAVYASFEDKTNMVKEAKGKYGRAETKQRGWQYLDL